MHYTCVQVFHIGPNYHSLFLYSRKQNKNFNVVSYLRGRMLHANYHEAPTELKWYITTASGKYLKISMLLTNIIWGVWLFAQFSYLMVRIKVKKFRYSLAYFLPPSQKAYLFHFFQTCLLLTIRHVCAIYCCENI